jgi:hypothetical protein
VAHLNSVPQAPLGFTQGTEKFEIAKETEKFYFILSGFSLTKADHPFFFEPFPVKAFVFPCI